MNERPPPPPIAVVGMGCEYPDARTPEELWENVLAGRRAFRRLPPERLRLEDYWSADRSAPDRLYATEAALIEGYEFDRVALRVPGAAYRAADLSHWLALDVALRALADAGLAHGDRLPHATTGVVLGNTLTGELTRAGTMRLRWPYVRRVVEAALREEEIDADRRSALLSRIEASYKAPFEPVGDETLAGALSNTIAGRICNHLDLNGGGYTVDGACAASLLAVATACERLASGELDVALAGGVDVSLDPFELVGFAKAGALAASEMRVYDERSEGFWPGEGCGFVVLTRLADALAERRRIHAVVRGWGVSSDGAGGITRPEFDGQLLAIKRAYARARVAPAAVGYFEGHGTGTALGDATELRALAEARRGADGPAAVGSIKANIGHTKAAAGAAGLIKAVLAVREGVLPPTTGCGRPRREIDPAVLRTLPTAEAWSAAERIAGVSAIGFGGIDSHAVVAMPPSAAVRERLAPRERLLVRSPQDAEVFLFAAATRTELEHQIDALLTRAAGLSRAELGDAAAAVAAESEGVREGVRAAVVAARPSELADRLEVLAELAHDGAARTLDAPPGVFLASSTRPPRVGLLLPGQGSPGRGRGGALRRRFAATEQLFASLPPEDPERDPTDTALAQPAIVTASLAALRVLARLGIGAEVAVGHSLGELTALAWAGALDEAAARRIATDRGRAMSTLSVGDGAMAGVELDRDGAERLAPGLDVVVAGLNGPQQTVVSGSAPAVDSFVALARGSGVGATRLPVSHAFHSPLVAPAAAALGEVLERERIGELQARVVSTVTGGELARTDDLRALLMRQVTAPVRFEEAVRHAAEGLDLLVEAGPGDVLTSMARRFISVPIVALDAGDESLTGVLRAAAAAWALGAPVRVDALFRDRFIRPLALARRPLFIANPCESAPVTGPPQPALAATPPESSGQEDRSDPVELVRGLVAERAELPIGALAGDSRLLDDLHLNSIVVSEIAVEASRRLGLPPPAAPNEFANATIADFAEAIAATAKTSTAARAEVPGEVPGAAPWLRAFAVVPVEGPAPPAGGTPGRGREWRVLAQPGDALAETLRAELPGGGTAVVLPPGPVGEAGLPLLLEGARAASEADRPSAFLLLHDGSGATGFGRSLRQEAPGCAVCLVDAPRDERAVERAVAEMAATREFTDARYGADGSRREPVLRHLPVVEGDAPLDAGDVVLASGGAKGIAAECMLALARATGAAIGLVGRSDPAADARAAANLERIAAAGVEVAYARADVGDPETVAAAVGKIERSLGTVTAVVHAAGSNEPRLIAEMDIDHLRAALSPKVDGLHHLLAAVDRDALRLLVTFGSIIARFGMRGEAHYALANELQTGVTEQFAANNPACTCLAFESSVWAAIGMGERLGAVDRLAQQGVEPIAPYDGARMLARLVACRDRPVATVVASRFGRPRELAREAGELPLLRFLERTPLHYAGVELVADSDLSTDVDPYLRDHVLEGEPVLPAVIALEAMAQAATALTGEPPAFDDVRFGHAVVAPAGETVTTRVAALAPEERTAGRMVVRSGRTGFTVDNVTASWPPPGGAPSDAGDLPDADGEPVALDPAELYGSLFFQDGRFRRLRRYLRLTATECVAEIEPGEPDGWFGRFLPQELVRGDPAARDAALHVLQACIPHAHVIPVSAGAIRSFGDDGPGPWRVRAREVSRSGPELTWDMAIVDGDGRVLERWDRLTLREIAPAAIADPWPEPLLANYVERRVNGVRVALTKGGGEPRELSARAIRRASGRPVELRHRPDGRPEAGRMTVSAAHAAGLTLAVAGDGRIACDLEAVRSKPVATWRDVVGPAHTALLSELEDDRDTAATRIWTAVECLQKVGVPAASPLTVSGTSADGWLTLACGDLSVATYVTRVRRVDTSLALAVLTGTGDAQL